MTMFRVFGMGHRRKLVYADGRLIDIATGEMRSNWDVAEELFEPAEYRVRVTTRDDRIVTIGEDEDELFLDTDGDRIALSRGAVRLPTFEGEECAAELRVLHGELLTCVSPFGPVPNPLVYPRPWYRDAAMMLMCFEKTGNLHLFEAWAAGLHKVHDRNNAGEPEADNLGQVLYLISLFDSPAGHPLVPRVLEAAKAFERDHHIAGRTDYAMHPVFQTKWMKYGLRALGLDDPYRVPPIVDDYDRLFWMDWRDEHIPGPRFDDATATLYPYLTWAESHFLNERPPQAVDTTASPSTWEAEGSEADYWRWDILPGERSTTKAAQPHSWHAAEAFLHLIDPDTPKA